MSNEFRTVVLGDSVMWGQGLLDSQKIHHHILTGLSPFLEQYRPGVQIAPAKVFAHSGAVIRQLPTENGIADQHLSKKYHGELPLGFPTIEQQVGKILGGDGVDLVIMNGGANDIGIFNLVDVAVPLVTFEQAILDACRVKFEALLTDVAAACPNAYILVMGYYPIVTDRSSPDSIQNVLAVLHFLSRVLGVKLPFSPVLDIPGMATRSLRWVELSNTALTDAISVAATATSGSSASLAGRCALVQPRFGSDDGILAPASKIWGLGWFGEAHDPLHLHDIREKAYRQHRLDFPRSHPHGDEEIQFVRRASCGHPNAAGAERIASAVGPEVLETIARRRA